MFGGSTSRVTVRVTSPGHGGEQRAVLVYQLASYWYWRAHFGRTDLTFGNFGENLTVDGLADDEVWIGDRYQIGEAEFEVTQPRVTCYRVGLRLGEPELPSLLVSHHRPGFYMRVITEGHIRAGDEIIKTRTCPGQLSVADTDALLYLPDPDGARLRVAVQIPALSPGWQESFHELLAETNAPQTPELHDGGPAWNGFRPLLVSNVEHDTPNVTSITLSATDGAPLPSAERRPVSHAAAGRRRRSGAGAELLALRPGRFRNVPDQRQARTTRHRQHVPEPRPAVRETPSKSAPLAESSCSKPGLDRSSSSLPE